MSHFYYQVLKKIQSKISIFQLFYLQMFQILLYIWTIQILFHIYNFNITHPTATNSYLSHQVIIFFIARGLTVYVRHRTYLLTPIIKRNFPKKERQLLINEIEEALQKSLEFTKWSCGILSTVLVLVTTMFFNVWLKMHDKTISDSDFIKEFEASSPNISDRLLLFVTIVAMIVGVVLAYYFILQLFSFHKKFVLKVLKNCEYCSPYYLSDCSKWKIILELAKEVFLWDSIKCLR
ncbi:hypothetical protein HO939_04345 [Streptococcus suis]|nr:hypothetical protein [Streptococcus suis]HEM5463454.1 hypothetical protein [Streptococcus suis]